MAIIERLKHTILNGLFPLVCLGDCGAEGEWVCTNCQSTLISRPQFLCAGCGRASSAGRTHKQCSKYTALNALVSFYPYAQPLVRGILKTFKYRSAIALGPLITGLTSAEVQSAPTLFLRGATFVPVPLHSWRERGRGFNQAAVIARASAAALGAAYAEPLTRTRITDTQADLPHHERSENVAGAFRSKEITGDIVLVDDVVTTGRTLHEAAVALRQAGASSVIGFALAYG